MFSFDKNPLTNVWDVLRHGASGEGPSPIPAATNTNQPAPAAGASPEAVAARSELGAPFADGLLGSVGAAAANLLQPVEHLGQHVGHWLGSLFGGDPAGAAAPQTAATPSGWALAGQEATTRNVTGDYQDLVARAQAGENTLPKGADSYAYLMVPGLLGNQIPTYLDPNVERMRALGLDTRSVPTNTEAGVQKNAELIRDMIEKIAATEHRQVVLTGQSKGAVEITAALAEYPELAEHVRAVVAMQAPYGGTPIADDVEKNPILRTIANQALTGVFNGDPHAVSDLTYGARQQFVGEHPYPASQVPTVSLATSSTSWTSPFAELASYMKGGLGLESDGLVPTNDQIVPGSDYVHLTNMDHAGSSTRLPGRGNADDPGDTTEALLTLALRKAQAQDDARKRP